MSKKEEEILEETEEVVEDTADDVVDETSEEETTTQEDVIAKKDEEIAELKDKYQRLMAEFENVRKRTAKEATQRYDMGAMGVLEKLLPVIDNFERGLDAVAPEEKDGAFVQGIEQIYKQLMGTMEQIGVAPMEAKGKEFDANLHNAVMHIEDEELGENIVAEEMQKGYMYKENVLRHSMVTVAN